LEFLRRLNGDVHTLTGRSKTCLLAEGYGQYYNQGFKVMVSRASDGYSDDCISFKGAVDWNLYFWPLIIPLSK